MKKTSNALSYILFFSGVLLGLTLSILSVWADFEANFYGFSRQTKNPFHGLNCPIMMARNESGTISIKVSNTSDKTIAPNVKTEISSPLTLVKTLDFVDLAPGESTTLQKTIGAENIDLEQFIFVKVLIYSAYPMSDQEGTCGVYILPINGNGTLILIAGTILSLLFTGGGVYLLRKNGLQNKHLNPLLFIAALIIPAMIFSFLGWWVPTVFVIVVLLLTFVIAIGNFAMQ
jgi:hypothetical protein